MAYDEVRSQHSWVVTHHLGWAENGEHVAVGGQHLSRASLVQEETLYKDEVETKGDKF